MHPRNYICNRISKDFELNGKLDRSPWTEAPWSESFVDILGDTAPAPKFNTRMKMMWSANYLYIGALLEEPHVWGTLTKRDSVIFYDNDFEVFIDPDCDNHLYYELEVNALNTVWDLLLAKPYRDGGPAINGWDIAGLKSAVHVDGSINHPQDKDMGWSVEIAIPWAALKECSGSNAAPPQPGDWWKINFSRVEWETTIQDGKYHKVPGKREDNWVWSPQGVVDMHRPEMWGRVLFATGATPLPDAWAYEDTLRQALMTVYWAQRGYHDKYGKFAVSPDQLTAVTMPAGYTINLEATRNTFEAVIHPPASSHGKPMRIREDSRITPA